MKISNPLLLKEFLTILIPPYLHGINLPLGPLIKIDRSDECEMHSHVTMDGAAIEAEEDTVCCGGPGGSCVGTIEAYSVLSDGEGDRNECNIIMYK